MLRDMESRNVNMDNSLSHIHFVIPGNPVTKSNFCMVNSAGKKFMPQNTGNPLYDKYKEYEDLIIRCITSIESNKQFKNGVIAVLVMYYKHRNKHPDTNNMPKSIFDGIEKSGIIINDIQVKEILLLEKYDKENPRVEVFLYDDLEYGISFTVYKRADREHERIEVLTDNDLSNIGKQIQCTSCSRFFPEEKLHFIGRGFKAYCDACYNIGEKNKKEDKVICNVCHAQIPKVKAKRINGTDNYVCINCILGSRTIRNKKVGTEGYNASC